MLLLKNKKVGREYQILETFQAGIALFGFEVKSLKNKRGSFEGAYISVNQIGLNKFEVWLKNFYIPPYQEKNTPENYDPYRQRQLLLQKKEIIRIQETARGSGITIVPIAVHLTSQNRIKLEIALARGLKKHDKAYQGIQVTINHRHILLKHCRAAM